MSSARNRNLAPLLLLLWLWLPVPESRAQQPAAQEAGSLRLRPAAEPLALDVPPPRRTVKRDVLRTFERVPSVFLGQWVSPQGMAINFTALPLVGASLYDERETSDFFRRNRIPEDSAADTFLDITAGRVMPFAGVPLYALARALDYDPLADFSMDLCTGLMVVFPEVLALRFVGDRPRPNGNEAFTFGLETPSSFPSGHVAVATTFATLADHHFGHAVGIPLYLLAGAAAYQRLGAGEHYLADVLGGALLGFGAARAIVRERRREQEGSAAAPRGATLAPLVGGRWGALGIHCAWRF